MKISKAKAIEMHLKRGHSLTQLQALKLFRHMRLASVIHRLRNKGLKISCDMTTGYARYFMPNHLDQLIKDMKVV